jgi:NADH dehydrogenase (ubiquinone) Fe-S protein 6
MNVISRLRPFLRRSSGIIQSPNRPTPWSSSQNPKDIATTGPRFEQTLWEYQPNPLSAQELIAQVPVTMVQGRKISCDGGGGALGHPKVYLNLDSGQPVTCGYCGRRFQQEE